MVERVKDPVARRIRVIIPVLLILVALNLVLLVRLLWPLFQPSSPPEAAAILPANAAQPALEAPAPATLAPQILPTLPPNTSIQEGLRQQGAIVLSMRDGANFHLFAYHPQFLPLTRLTDSAWDDSSPAISPDGVHVAFSSNKSGFWDLYLLDLSSGEVSQLTDTQEYDGAPTWSPDGEWIAYESYHNNNLDIFLLSVTDLSQPPTQLTDDPSADYAPAWSPDGRNVAFVSMRSDEEEIWLARLDDANDRFTDLSKNTNARETHPAWSPDGRYLVWTAHTNGLSQLDIWDSQNPDLPARHAGYGEEASWSPDGQALLARVITPNQNGLSIYQASSEQILMPLTPLPGELHGITWIKGEQTGPLSERVAHGSSATAEPLFQSTLTLFPIAPVGRMGVVPLDDVQAPFPMLQDQVDESFIKLRQMTASLTGWDLLGNLENAYMPLTQASAPGMEENWLYTGRAFATNPLLVHAGWMSVIREDINGQTYWRVYLKARYQDGSMGAPMTDRPWDLDARYNGDPKLYEQGGQLAPVPEGYWIDFTELASRYGWERLPALVSWITYYPAARFNQFIMSAGLDWQSAMLEIYPPEAMATATSAPTKSPTPRPSPTK